VRSHRVLLTPTLLSQALLIYNPRMSSLATWRVCLLSLLAVPLLGQPGSIQGIVKDQTEATIAGAQVEVTNLDTGLRRDTKSNEAGLYTVPALPVGRYKITANTTGFSVSEVPEIMLDVNQTARVDFVLKPGAVAESINVSATAALLDSETATVGQVIDNKRI